MLNTVADPGGCGDAANCQNVFVKITHRPYDFKINAAIAISDDKK